MASVRFPFIDLALARSREYQKEYVPKEKHFSNAGNQVRRAQSDVYVSLDVDAWRRWAFVGARS